jgi:hypothetical protein
MKIFNKIILWLAVIGFIFFNAIAIWHDSHALLKHIYVFAGLYKVFIVLWSLSIVYVIIAYWSNGVLFKKIFLPLIGKAEPSDKDCKAVYQGLFVILLILGLYTVFLSSGLTVFSAHKCKENKMDNCIREQSTLKILFFPVIGLCNSKKNVSHSFQDSNILYFSSKILPEKRSNALHFLFLFLVPIVTIRSLKLFKK